MPADQVSQLFLGIARLIDRFPEPLKYQAGTVAEKIIQDIGLVLEIDIDGTVSNPCLPCDLGNGGLIETLLGKNLDRGIHDPLVFAVILMDIFLTPDNLPLAARLP